jgi:thiol-disulfide isomerase/thioredoxin
MLAVWAGLACAGEPGPANAPEHALTLEVFIRSDSERSLSGAAFARQLSQRRRGLRVVVHDVLSDNAARQQFWDLSKKFGAAKPGLPAFFACNRARFGFADASASAPAIESLFVIRAFVREGCGHCRDAKRFLLELQQRWPAMRIEQYDVVTDPTAERRLTELEARYGAQVSAFPAIELCGRFVVGYDTDATTGRRIEDILREASDPLKGMPGAGQPSKTGRAWQGRPAIGAHRGPTIRFAGLYSLHTDQDPVTSVDVPPLPPVAEEDTTVVAPQAAPREGIEIPGWGMLYVRDLGFPTFTFVIGLVDGFNPCAMWVLVFLLSILVNIRDRTKILAIAGTFVLISGLAYFAFMAAWLNVFLIIGYMRSFQITLGVLAVLIGLINVKDFVAFKRGISLSIPESAKAGIYARVREIVTARYLGAAVAMAVVLAISVNVVELLCTAGLPALYTQILTVQQFPPWQNYAYLLLYNLAYMLDDSLMLGVFVVTLSHRKIQEREGRWLKLISGLVILVLGLVMLFRPEWLELTSL